MFGPQGTLAKRRAKGRSVAGQPQQEQEESSEYLQQIFEPESGSETEEEEQPRRRRTQPQPGAVKRQISDLERKLALERKQRMTPIRNIEEELFFYDGGVPSYDDTYYW